MPIGPFVPQYIFESELQQYGLPTTAAQSDILTSVQFCSYLIDEECGRIDGDGNGSLVYTTYTHRVLVQTRNRNLIQVPIKPISAVSASEVATLQSLASSGTNTFYTGVIANTLTQFTGQLSGIVGCSGRYGYSRQDMSVAYPDLFAFISPLNLVTMFGGPAPFVPIDVTMTDYQATSGEVWPPAGLQLQRYSELIIQYNSGFDPQNIPFPIKFVCASMVKNGLAKGNFTTGMMSMSLGKSGMNASFFQSLVDPTLDRYLTPFRNVRSY